MPKTITLALSLLMSSLPLLAQAQDDKDEEKEGFLPEVEEPIPDTYEPLKGADWNHRLSPELQTLRKYQQQQEEKRRQEERQRRRDELESKIQAPDPGQVAPPPEPEIEQTEDGMRISDPE